MPSASIAPRAESDMHERPAQLVVELEALDDLGPVEDRLQDGDVLRAARGAEDGVRPDQLMIRARLGRPSSAVNAASASAW